MNPAIFALFLFFVNVAPESPPVRFYVIRQWKYANFTWPDEDTLKTAVSKGHYIPENVILSGVKYYKDHFYITLPRMKNGVPATLARIPAGMVKDVTPNLEPFPSWKMNDFEDCNSLQNVQNVEVDDRGMMWVIDGGRVETMREPVGKCNPKLLIYDIEGDRVTTVYQFPEEVASKNGSFLYDLVVDKTDGGYAYITDNSARDPGIIVYSVKENRSWKIRDNRTMAADPSAVQFSVNDISINAPINIAGIALGPKVHTSNDKVVVNEDREVFFAPLSSLHLYSINTSVLRDENQIKNMDSSNVIKDLGLKPSQTVGMVMDNQGVLYYSLLGNNAIGRWDSHTPFQSGQRLVARDNKYLEWPNSFTFDGNGNLTILTNRLNKFIFDKFDLNEYNFRLISAHVDGESYINDGNFKYNVGTTHEPTSEPEPIPEPGTSGTRLVPEPRAHQPMYGHNDHDHHDHDHSSVMDDRGTTTSTLNEVKIMKASGNRVLVGLVTLVLGVFVAFA